MRGFFGWGEGRGKGIGVRGLLRGFEMVDLVEEERAAAAAAAAAESMTAHNAASSRSLSSMMNGDAILREIVNEEFDFCGRRKFVL